MSRESHRRDYTKVFDAYPPARTLLPDEINPILGFIAYVLGTAAAYYITVDFPLGSDALFAAMSAPLLTLVAYVILHMATGLPWITSCENK